VTPVDEQLVVLYPMLALPSASLDTNVGGVAG
jgi:hypothetical protein